ncbi:HEAT repeat domain-containing protein [Nannocystis sp. ILAH1]|uniref:HEAT repeat domain-containing protein n=1 Tax=unclassified Nannocystis TaxID=2627009 RepID=UPI00226DB0B1|nr:MULTISPECIES: sporulation protein [unclassified Nannocystis]MCY0995191.1 HEAT repeat domain-containing protein [Nannocystis sp. ILAH1]MCY1069869.1 HEAT repeat domain-containing protein [Nannocystis sp. RBIL2]
MGLLNKLFGGGTQLDLKLDLDKVPPGGTVAGSLTLTGGKKPLKLTALKVDIVSVLVQSKEGSSLPSIDIKVLSSNIVAQDRDLAPGSLNKFEFRYKIPEDAKPDATYKIMASADIPGVKDPSAEAPLTVLGGGRGLFGAVKSMLGGGDSENVVLERFPGLTSHDTDELENALHELQCEAYDRDNNFTGIHKFLLKLVETHREDGVRRAALSAWGTVLDNRAKPEHIKALETLAGRDLPSYLMEEVVSVAAKFAEEGGLPLVQQLARHPAPEVRARLATALYLDADHDLQGRRELILQLCQDGDVSVRANAFGATASLVEQLDVMQWVASWAAQDPSPEVQAQCLSAIALAHNYGGADLVFDTYLQHAQGNPSADVRKEITERLHWLPTDPRLTQLVTTLLSDRSSEVRRSMAWQGCNMEEHPELGQLFVHTAVNDPDDAVRADALRGIDKFMPLPEAVQFLRQRLAADRNEKAFWAALNAVEGHMPAREAQALLQEIARGPFSSAGERAREVLAGE